MSESPSTGWNRPSSGPGRNRRACERVLDDWVGRLQVYVPTGYKLSLPATGSIAVQAIETQIGPSNIGKLTGALKTAPAGDATVAWASANCDTGAHVAVSSVAVAGNDDSWILPVFVDNTTGTETQFGSQKLVVCFGPRGPGGSNAMANKLLTMTLNGVSAPTTAGDYTWRSLWTPFAGTSGDTSTRMRASRRNRSCTSRPVW